MEHRLSRRSKYTFIDDDDDFIYHKVEGSKRSKAYLAGLLY